MNFCVKRWDQLYIMSYIKKTIMNRVKASCNQVPEGYQNPLFGFNTTFCLNNSKFCQSCSCSLNVLNLKITCQIWHLTGTVCSSYYYLNTYYFTKCSIIFHFHNSLYVHTTYTASLFMFLSFLFLHPQNSLISILLFFMMPKGERI